MKIRQCMVFVIAFVLSFSTVAFADSIQQRVNAAYMRIDRGIQTGALTREEAHRLKSELRNIRETEVRMLADGRLNHHERERLHNDLDRLERHISHLKHNDNTRGDDRRYDDRRHDDRGHDGRRY